MRRRHVLAIIAVIALNALIAITAQRQVVILKDGRRLPGEVTKTENGYRIRMHGGTVVVAADQVLRIEDIKTSADELKQRLGKVDPRDAEGYYHLARWAANNDLLTEAKDILTNKVLKLNPRHENARLLLKLVEIRLAGSGPPVATTTSGPHKPTLDPSRFLKKEDIYRIRLMELRPKDRVVIEFRKKVLDRFIESMRGEDIFAQPSGERKFRGWSKVRKARYILEHTDRDNASIRDDILVKTDPAVMKEFRTRVWPIIARSFASPSCYGGVKGRDGMKLFNVPLTDERIMYTNFYILHKWQRGGRKFIERDNRQMSLLLQYGLPRKLAKIRAPDYVKPIFRSRRDRNYKIIDNWIASLRWPFLSPGYRIDFKLPGEQPKPPPPPPATQPAEE